MFWASEAVSAAVRCQPDYSHHRVTGTWTDIRGGPNMTSRAETGRIQAPRQIKQAGLKMIQTLNPGAETYRPKTGAQSSDLQLSEIYQGVNREENISSI